jgi:hypothetical protein
MKFIKLLIIICIIIFIKTNTNTKSPSIEIRLGSKCIFSKLKNSCESNSQNNLLCDDLMGKCRLSNGQKCKFNSDPYISNECLSTSICIAQKGKIEGICTDKLNERINKVFGISSNQ